MSDLETDYLVVGAGLTGLGFADSLLAADGEADVVVVDRRDGAGGHWLDAYPFVRLHLPSAFYGVASRPLDRGGRDAEGLAERATGAEVVAYLQQVLDDLVAGGRLRFVGGHDRVERPDGTSVLVDRSGGSERTVTVRRAVVDAAYLEGEVPARHRRGFAVDDDARCVPPGALPSLGASGERYTVLGAGKTAMDACTWLLEQGVEPARVRWVRPRDPWLIDRRGLQPHDDVGSVIEGFSLDVEAAATTTTDQELFDRLEATGRLLRLDPAVEPTMYHCAIVSPAELEQLRGLEDVVRLGHVRRVSAGRLVLEQGEVAAGPGEVAVDCTASGLRRREGRPVFEPGRITPQQVRPCSPSFNAALTGYVAASREDVAEQDALCPVQALPEVPADWNRLLEASLSTLDVWRQVPDVQQWIDRCPLDVAHGLDAHHGEPRVQEALGRFLGHVAGASERLRAASAPHQRRPEGSSVTTA